MDAMQLRPIPAMAALSVWATGGEAAQGLRRLFLPPVLRQSNLREPAPEHEGAVVFAGL